MLSSCERRVQEPKTEVAEVFGGVTRSRVTCLSCQAVSDKLDPFYDLSLDLHDCSSVDDALDSFIAPDRLEGSNLYCCDACKRCGTLCHFRDAAI